MTLPAPALLQFMLEIAAGDTVTSYQRAQAGCLASWTSTLLTQPGLDITMSTVASHRRTMLRDLASLQARATLLRQLELALNIPSGGETCDSTTY